MPVPTSDIAGARRSHARLLETVGAIDDDVARRPSRLPGWNVAMLVTHLARNADSHTGMLEGAIAGESRPQYPSVDAREADIAAGRDRAAADLVADLWGAVDRLEQTWANLSDEAWAGFGRTTAGALNPVADLPFQRWREVEVHHADLGLGFTFRDWDEEYAELELKAAMEHVEDRLPPDTSLTVMATIRPGTQVGIAGRRRGHSLRVDGDVRELVAWLLDREPGHFPELAPWKWAPR